MAALRCPGCGGEAVRRCSRRGVLERLLSVAYVFPFRCSQCSRRFRALRWAARYTRQPIDRREYERVPVRVPVTLWAGEERADGEVVDLSLAGCAIRSDAPFAPGTTLRLQLRIPAAGSLVEIEAADVRGARPGVLSVVFQRVAERDRLRLRQFVGSLLRPDGVDRRPRASTSAGVWLATLVIVLVFVAVLALIPSIRLCVSGVSC